MPKWIRAVGSKSNEMNPASWPGLVFSTEQKLNKKRKQHQFRRLCILPTVYNMTPLAGAARMMHGVKPL